MILTVECSPACKTCQELYAVYRWGVLQDAWFVPAIDNLLHEGPAHIMQIAGNSRAQAPFPLLCSLSSVRSGHGLCTPLTFLELGTPATGRESACRTNFGAFWFDIPSKIFPEISCT